VREILDTARWAPSGGNLQPWRIIVLAGEARQAVTDLARRTQIEATLDPVADRPVYPANLWEPYRSRRFKLGEDMYALLGITRRDREGRLARWAANYDFFGAPVGLFFVIDERMGHAQWAHLGMLILAVALAAQSCGLGTCMQEAWASFRAPLKETLHLEPHAMIYCGMALGYADEHAPVNHLRSERMPVSELASFYGFE
jgi:nitroreductase